MKYLLDTNILLRLCDRQNSQHQIIRNAILNLRREGHQLYILPQNCTEFWNVATRPKDKNGYCEYFSSNSLFKSLCYLNFAPL